MDFPQFVDILYKHIGKGSTQPEFVKSLFENILCEEKQAEYENACVTKDKSNEIYKAIDKQRVSYQKIFTGERGIKELSKKVFPYADPESFISIFEDISYPTMVELCNDFKEEIPDIDYTNAGIKLGELFTKILKEALSQKKKTSVSVSKETSVTSNEQKAETFPDEAIITETSSEEPVSTETTCDEPVSTETTCDEPVSTETTCDEPVSTETSSEEPNIAISEESPSNDEDPYLNFSIEDLMQNLKPGDLHLLEEFITDYDPILEECIKTQYTVIVNIDLPDKIHYMKDDRWLYKSIKFQNTELRNFIYDIINTLDELRDYISDIYMRVSPGATYDTLIPRKTHRDDGFPVHDVLSKETTRIKNHLRVLYIALHPGAKNSPAFADLKSLYHSDKFPAKEN